MEFSSESVGDTKRLAQKFAETLKRGNIVFFIGKLGSGKTTFISLVADSLGFTGRVQSPTFVIERIYKVANGVKIYHIDLYRLDLDSIKKAGILEELDKNGIYFVEWADKLKGLVKPSKTVEIDVTGEFGRRFKIND